MQVNAIGASLLEYIADFGKPYASSPAAIVACIPKTIHQDTGGVIEFSLTGDEIIGVLTESLDEPLSPEAEVQYLLKIIFQLIQILNFIVNLVV